MFDPVRICEILNDEAVDYVIVGGFAAVVHASVAIAALDDIIESERAAHRLEDQMALPYPESLREQIGDS